VSESNVIDASDLHAQKQYSQITSTDVGMWIDIKPVLENAKRSSRETFVSQSNVTDPSDVH
jgi:hypothetical protein